MRFAPFLLAAVLPLPAVAQGASGTIEGRLDFDDARWTVGETEDAPSSSWRETEDGIEVELHGYSGALPTDDDSRITMSFTLPDGAGSTEVTDPVVELNQDSGPNLRSAGSNLDVELSDAAIEGDRLTVSGGLNATLTFGEEDIELRDPGSDTRTFDGNFLATVTRAD